MNSDFDYHRPSSVEDAVRMKCDLGSKSCFRAGRTDLVPQWKSGEIKPLHCIDLTAIAGLGYINSENDAIRIGGLTTLSEIERAERRDPCLRTLTDMTDGLLQRIGEATSEDATPISDVRANAGYRTAMTRILVRPALEDIRGLLSGGAE